LKAQVPVTEPVTVTDTVSFPDALENETITTTDAVTVTPLIAVAAPVVFYSAGSLGFNGVTTQSINVSAIGQAPLTLSSAATSPSSTFTIGAISCTNGATSMPTTLPAGGVCTFTISSLSPGTATSGTLVFTDNAALSNVASTQAGASFTQSIALNDAANSTPPPPPPPAVVTIPITETITVTDTPSFLDALDNETITTTDAVTVTPLIAVAAPVVFYSAGSLGFGSVAAGQTATQSITVSAIGQAPLTLSSTAISQSSAFTVGAISCTNGATSLPTTLPAGGACSFPISFLAPSGTATSGTITFTDNAALSNVASTPAGSSFTQSIALNGAGSSAPPPPPPPAVETIPVTETITVTDTMSFLDALDNETITTTDAVTVTPLIAVAAPVVFYSAGSLGFGNVSATQSIQVSAIGQAPLMLSSAAISQSTAFTVGPISCTNGATSLPTTLPAGGACTFPISFLSPSGPAPSGTITFTDNAALSNVASTPAGSSFTQSIALNGAGSSTPPPPPPPAVVTIPVTETITVTDTPSFLDALDNETITITDAVTVQVIHVTPIVTWVTPAAITYGTALSGTQLDATAIYNGAPVPGTFVYTPASGTVLGVGSQMLAVSFTPNDTTTYTTATGQVTLIVNLGTATVSVTGGTFSYDGSPHAGSGFAYGVGGVSDVQTPTVTLNYIGIGATTYGPSATAPTNAGTYQMTASFAGNANYGPASNLASITINRAAAMVTPAAASKTYGTADPAFTGTLSGFVAADGVTASYSRTAGETVAGSPYTISATLAPAAVLGNYTITYNTANFTITAVPLTITASGATVAYGAVIPAITPSYAGFVNGDTSASLTTQPACSATVPAGNPVGTYTTKCAGAVDPNYTINYLSGTLQITAVPLIITASNGAMIYGGAVPVITRIYTGFVNGDTALNLTAQPICSTNAAPSSNVGSYLSSCLGAVDANYVMSYRAGMVTVTAAPLVVTAPTLSRVWGIANAGLTPVITGFVNGQTSAVLTTQPTCSTVATTASPVGIYPVTCTGGMANNYVFSSYVAGTLTVTTALQLTPAVLSFGNVLVGRNLVLPATVTSLTNFGGLPLAISRSITGTNLADFRIAGSSTCGGTLAAGATCIINVRFQPAAAIGLESAILNVSAVGNPTVNVALSGTGIAPAASVSPTTIKFGNVSRGQLSTQFTVTVTNTGIGPLTFNTNNGFALGGANPGQFRLTPSAPCANGRILPQNGSCTLTVVFAPTPTTAHGAKSATLFVRSNATNGTQTVSLTGTAMP
jgi:hypothetical protein